MASTDHLPVGHQWWAFPELAGSWADRVQFVRTESFFGKRGPVGQSVIKAFEVKYPDVKSVGDIVPPVGVANAYDALARRGGPR